ncbi:maltose acetyltransferase [Veronia nyctiphanis]|uniref:Maltose acetyltransferase n=1 Tax=Veronia nyctiphanis TaxID=1278244 RepID=A0A4Q0YTP5_9GAMM|nr:sugar O-acetyltransferase [Veronia nyctiphanis]RXJ74105.1 maltose acetyltransferase [Veronia nyctiphanis]
MTEFEKMQQGLPYRPADEELTQFRYAARRLCQSFNSLDPSDAEQQDVVLTKLFASRGRNVVIETPFYCQYGMNIDIGDNVIIGLNCSFIDSANVHIGSNVRIGPDVKIYTVTQGLLPEEIKTGEQELASPVVIGNNVLINGGCIIKAGTAIGEGAVIHSGAVVEGDVAPCDIVAGNPGKVVGRLR